MFDQYIPNMDDLPCGCMVVGQTGDIMFGNRALLEELGWGAEQLVGRKLETIMSDASHVFCETQILPLLLQEGECQEIQLTFLTPEGHQIPMIANAKTRVNGDTIWSVYTAINRDSLYDELVRARDQMAEQSKRLAVQASTDELTGLMNRRAFNAAIEAEFVHCEDTGQPLSLLMIDVDNFKRINDLHGHKMGDDVLRKLGACLRQACGDAEIAARYGGEEFIVAMAGATHERAVAFANHLQSRVAHDLAHPHPVTVSIGIGHRSGCEGPGFQDLLGQADRAMYRAKEMGKNLTIVAGGARDAIPVAANQTAIAPRWEIDDSRGVVVLRRNW